MKSYIFQKVIKQVEENCKCSKKKTLYLVFGPKLYIIFKLFAVYISMLHWTKKKSICSAGRCSSWHNIKFTKAMRESENIVNILSVRK